MYKNNLPEEHIFQNVDDENCGPACLAMAYRILGKKVDVEEILKDLKIKKKGRPTFPPELAGHLLRNNIKTRLIISSPRIISPAWADLNNKELVKNLEVWLALQKNHRAIMYKFAKQLVPYVKSGGVVELKSYSSSDLKEMLDNGSLLILCVDEVWLWGHRLISFTSKIDEFKGKSSGHYVLVKSYHGDKFEVYDPFPTKIPERNGIYWIDQNQLLNASLIWAATVLEIENK